MAKRIAPVVKGSEETLLTTTKANELIGVVNSLANMTFIPTNAAKLDVGEDGGAVLTFNMDVLGGGGATPTNVEDVVRQVLSTAVVIFTCSTPGVIHVQFGIPPAGPP